MNWDSLIYIVSAAIVIYTLYDLWAKNGKRSMVGKILWTLAILFTGPFGIVLYWILGRR